MGSAGVRPVPPATRSSHRVRTLFISPHNAARSLLAEALLRKLAPPSWLVASCGVPGLVGGMPQRVVLEALERNQFPSDWLHSKSWFELQQSGLKGWDFVITLADDLPQEMPVWLGNSTQATWSYAPLCGPGLSAEYSAQAVQRALYSLRRRIELLISLNERTTSPQALRDDLRDLGRM